MGDSMGKDALPRTIRASKHQTGFSKKAIDKKRKAMKPGKRLSKSRKEYYESRRNRSDLHPSKKL